MKYQLLDFENVTNVDASRFASFVFGIVVFSLELYYGLASFLYGSLISEEEQRTLNPFFDKPDDPT